MSRSQAGLSRFRWLLAAGGVALVLATVVAGRRTAHASKVRFIRITCSLAPSGERTFSGLTAVIVSNGWLERELRQRGVAIEWVPVSGSSVGPIINEGFASGTIDIASYGDLPSIIANAAGVRTELIVPSGRGSDTHLLVPPDSSAQSILDLKGKRIAIHRGRPWELPFSRLIDSVGLTYDDFQVLNLEPQAGAAALAARKVDALYTISPYLLVEKGVGKIIWSNGRGPSGLEDAGRGVGIARFRDTQPGAHANRCNGARPRRLLGGTAPRRDASNSLERWDSSPGSEQGLR
jgi:sulfonate transport system substrate-binding protein